MSEFSISTRKKTEFIEITEQIQELVSKSKVLEGICIVYCPHTTAAIVCNENADGGAIWQDLGGLLERLVPENKEYRHSDGNAHAHLKASLFGNSKTLLVQGGKLMLGTWEGVFLGEFDGPRPKRRILVKVVKNP